MLALLVVNWGHLMSVFVQVSSDCGVMHGLFVVGSSASVVMTGLISHVFASRVVIVTPVGVISASAVPVGVVVMVDGLVSGLGSLGSCLVFTVVVVMDGHMSRVVSMRRCVVHTVGGVVIFTVLSRGNSDNCAKDEGSHMFRFDFYLIL